MISDDYRAGFVQGWRAGAQAQLAHSLRVCGELPTAILGNKQADGRPFRPTDVELAHSAIKSQLSALGTVPPPEKVK